MYHYTIPVLCGTISPSTYIDTDISLLEWTKLRNESLWKGYESFFQLNTHYFFQTNTLSRGEPEISLVFHDSSWYSVSTPAKWAKALKNKVTTMMMMLMTMMMMLMTMMMMIMIIITLQ